ncbi:hypothetical protein KIN20_028483 [Parelaphostrongylus tenuis]|uniref:Uncharacterized protein n=1 Tax=Parelaphostrongylus tenuis TaxID=148309 RepID=A0AAD5WER1_PARTN|nr:hypothetical protein KIN20_028483 [Parelaphostrongylus tenuis]
MTLVEVEMHCTQVAARSTRRDGEGCQLGEALFYLFAAAFCKFGCKVSVACNSCDSTLTNQLECLWRQAFLRELRTPGVHSVSVEISNELIVFFVDVVDKGIFRRAD